MIQTFNPQVTESIRYIKPILSIGSMIKDDFEVKFLITIVDQGLYMNYNSKKTITLSTPLDKPSNKSICLIIAS